MWNNQARKNFESNLFKVNLLVNREESSRIYLNAVKWMISSGRYLIILVELIVIGAFIYRYKLDTDLQELQDKINEQIPYINSLKSDEILIRETQFQLANIKQIKNDRPDYVQIFVRVASLTPKNIKLTNIALDRARSFPKTTISITGETPSNLELSAFIKLLKKDPFFSEIILSNISFEQLTTFTITGALAERAAKST